LDEFAQYLVDTWKGDFEHRFPFSRHRAWNSWRNHPSSGAKDTYHRWREGNGYEEVAGFCKSATKEEIAANGYVLTPGGFVGAEDLEDGGEPFEAKISRLGGELDAQFAESAKLESAIRGNLSRLGFSL